MTVNRIYVGRFSHTAALLGGYCPSCGLHHSGPLAALACAALCAASGPETEVLAWRALKAAIAREGS